MTACAMTVGMVPMALALERGSQMQAPLGLAVIGGLVMSTFATLLVLPSIFAVVIGRSVAHSPSIYPDDPDSAYYDPLAYSQVDEKVTPDAVERVPSHAPLDHAEVVHVERVASHSQTGEHSQAPDDHPSGSATNVPPESPSFPGDH
jgi:hypothetical protein